MTQLRSLSEGWSVSAVAGEGVPDALRGVDVPATVPGCVHTDLLAAGLIDDPYLDDNETRLSWIGRTDWRYQTTFDWTDDGGERVDLVCDGLDTVATIELNGVEVGRTANMHRSYRFDVRSLLREGPNQLVVRFDSAYRYAEAMRDALGERPNAYDEPFQYIRKMACNFGWDWGPTVVTAGIWRWIGLHSWSTARLAEVRPLVTVADGVGRVEVQAGLARAWDAPLVISVEVAGALERVTVPAGHREARVTVTVDNPELWWPRGYGDQHRYPIEVALIDPESSVLDRWHSMIGFRSVRVDTTPDSAGTPFTLVVNDVPVFVRGANWIPDDAFLTRLTRGRYAERIGQACDAGVNLLRVWGGGRYECDDFYDLADANGVLVAQDFLFACAAYPEEEPLASEVAAEAREHVARLTPHPSLVLWCGNNENIWGWHDWDWQAKLDGRSWGLGYYLSVLPGIVAELDPTRPYWPGSPYSGDAGRHPNEPAHGTTHIWDVWNTHDYTHYRSYRPRFVAEFGFQGPPAYATLRRAVSDTPLAPDSPGVMHHQKAIDGNGKLLRGLSGHLPAPRDFDDWHYATQLNQARAVRFGIEHFRSLRPLCSGTIMWQLNDCWPVTSWAAVDGDGRRKPLWYALRQAYADRLLTFQPRDGDLALVAVNDSRTGWSGQLDVVRYTVTGELLAKVTVDLDVASGAAQTITLPDDVTRPGESAAELLVAGSAPGEEGEPAAASRALWFFTEDVEVAYPAPVFDSVIDRVDGGYRVHLTARTLLRDLALFADRVDPAAQVDEALITLLPGESTTLHVRTGQSLDTGALVRHPVLRCVNDLVAG